VSVWTLQREVCDRYGALFHPTDPDQIVGVARNLGTGLEPLNGLRHPAVGTTCGWYFWAGEKLSQDPDYFQPMHAAHLAELCPEVVPYLGLGPGWRLLIARNHVDVWYDPALLQL